MGELQTNVKQGAMIGGWVCFGVGTAFMFLSLWAFIFYAPLFFAAFVLSIVAMSQRRVAGGLTLLLCCVIIPPLTFLGLMAHRVLSSDSSRSPSPSTQLETAAPSSNVPQAMTAGGDLYPKAISLDEIITKDKSKMASWWQLTSAELRAVKSELLTIPRNNTRYPEVRQMLHDIDSYIDTATKVEAGVVSTVPPK